MIESNWRESSQPEPRKTRRKVWIGDKMSLPQTIRPGGFSVISTIGGHKFAVLRFSNGSKEVYNLQQTPVYVEHYPFPLPVQNNLKAAWMDAELLRSNFLIPHEITYRDGCNNQLCQDVFRAAYRPTFLRKVELIAQKYSRPFLERFRCFRLKLT